MHFTWVGTNMNTVLYMNTVIWSKPVVWEILQQLGEAPFEVIIKGKDLNGNGDTAGPLKGTGVCIGPGLIYNIFQWQDDA